MKDSLTKPNGFISFGTLFITYVLVKIVYKLTGFHYDFGDGIFNIKLVIDIALWVLIYFPVQFLLKKTIR